MAAACLLIFSLQLTAQDSSFRRSLTATKDTTASKIKIVGDIIKGKDTGRIRKTDTINVSRDSLTSPVSYTAQDSGVLIIPTRQFILYGKATADSKGMNLKAGTIDYNQETQLIKAYNKVDSNSSILDKAKMDQGDLKSMSDSIIFNMKNFKGLTKNTYVQQGEIYINAERLKKIDSNTYYAYRARFTTCNLDTPHFAFRTRRMKMISNKLGISGPTSVEFEGVPIPIGIPFGIYPLNTGRHSGILPPQFTQSEDFGLGLEGLGFYKVLNDYSDVTIRSNIYSYGGWSLNISPEYIKRYKYNGRFSITFQNNKLLNRNFISKDEYNTTKSFMINWSHSQDTRSRPGTSFSASVNFGSTRFNQSLLNNPMQNFQNQLSSSISYSKTWNGKANLTLNINHSQNSVTRLVSMSLPTGTYTLNTLYPFQKKDKVGTPKWYENIGIGYSGNFTNQINFYDTAFSLRRLLDTAQWGVTHSIPISLTLPSLGVVTLAPSVSYNEHWYGQKISRSWDSARNKVDTLISKGFYAARQMSFGISANTAVFGTFKLKHATIRHVMRPSISMSYQPDMNSQFYRTIQVDSLKHTLRFSQFDGVVPGAFGEGSFGGVGFGIDNSLEMKVKDKSDTSATAYKKVKLIEGFGFTSSYNLMADSFALSPFNLYARSTLFGNVNISANATMDPYEVDKFGYRVNKLQWNDPKHFSLGTITNGSVAISTSFKSKSKDPKKDSEKLPDDPFMTPDEQQRQLQYARSNPAEFTDFNIPWTLSLSYSLSFSKSLRPDSTGAYSYVTQTYSNINFSGDFSLTDKWKIGGNGYYDMNSGKLQQFSMFISREMHCWQLAINITPIGLYHTFSITLSPKSGILRDLKINRTRTFSNY